MFTKFSLLLQVVISALTVAATPALQVKINGPGVVTDVANLKVDAVVTNTGDQSLKLLKDPRGVLDNFPAESFAVQHSESGASPQFVGPRLKYVPSKVVEMNEPSSFAVLNPGESYTVTHDLSSAYDFTQTGEGTYTFAPLNSFYYVDPATSQPKLITAETADAHELAISGSLASTSNAAPTSNAAGAFVGCSASQQADITAAIAAAEDYASDAAAYADANTSGTPRYVTWFGTYSDARHNIVKSHFDNVNGNDFSSFTYDCSTCTKPGTFAYVYPNRFGQIFLCPVFWQVPVTGTDSKGGTLVHEATHFTKNGGTIDVRKTYGQAGCKALARSNPDEATMNADNHEYYAENNPPLA